METHKLLVDKSNHRILKRIEEIKMKRQREAIAEQEKLVTEQQSAANALRNIRKQRQSLKRKPVKMGSFKTQRAKEINFNAEEKKQVLEWLDLKRNAAILDKTDKAIAEKLKARNADLYVS